MLQGFVMSYGKPRLKRRGSNGVWRVHIRIPSQLYKSGAKEVRLSTGTVDQRLASQLMHKIVSDQYALWDEEIARLKTFDAFAKEYAPPQAVDALSAGLTLNRNGESYTVQMDERLQHEALLIALARQGVEIPRSVLESINPQALDHATRPRASLKIKEDGSDPRLLSNVLPQFVEFVGNPKDRAVGRVRQLAEFLDKPISSYSQYDIYDFLQFANDSSEEGLTTGTLHTYKSGLSQFFVWASTKRELEVTDNPTRNVKERMIASKASKRRLPISFAQAQKLVQHFKGSDLLPFIKLQLGAGLRIGEASQAGDFTYWDDDIQANVLDLRKAQVKNNSSRRVIPLHPSLEIPKATDRMKHLVRMNKALKDFEITSHSLRHTYTDFCRAVPLGLAIEEELCGHGRGDSHSRYGSGYSLKQKLDAVMSVKLPW